MARRVIGRVCGAVAVLAVLGTANGRALGADVTAGTEPAVIFDNTSANGGLNAAGASPASQLDSFIPFEAGAADDFTLAESPLCLWSITGVRWTGVYWEPDPGAISAFRIIIWPDGNDHPAGDGAATPNLSEALKIYDIPGPAGETERGSGVYDYEATLPEPFAASPGVRYWIEIQSVMDYPPQWGWHVTTNRQGAGPMEYFDILRMPAWTPIPDTGDLAYALLGTPLDVSCDDGSACTVDSCVAGECISEPIACDDGNACTEDSCSPNQGCIYTPISCDDGDACTTDSCDAATGCAHASVVCDDNDACTEDSCSPQDGCVFAPVGCDDENACTIDSCDAATGCVHDNVSCDDGNACTTDTCDAATGCAHEAMSCNDNDACTEDTCSPEDGCAFTPITCDDASVCTTDSCDSQIGCVFADVTCDDQNACTTDSCDPSGGCSFTPIDCNDGDACTVDRCDGGACSHLAPPDFDGNGMIDAADSGVLAACMAGPTITADESCSCADLNGDGRVDLGDFAVLQTLYSENKP